MDGASGRRTAGPALGKHRPGAYIPVHAMDMGCIMQGRIASGRWLLALLLSVPLAATAATQVLLTGEWPPYTGVREPEGGSMAAIVRAVYASQGDDVRLGYFSWFRIARLLDDNRGYTASFPHYYSAERSRRCHFSQSIGSSPLGLVSRLALIPQWKTVSDLQRYRIGVGKSYVNVPEFDQLVKRRQVQALSALDDADNLHNLLSGKVDAVLIDRNVFAYLMNTEAFRGSAQQLRLDPRVLAMHNLYMCFPRHEKGRVARDRFNQGFAQLRIPTPDIARQ